MKYTKGEWKKEGNKIIAFGRGIIAVCPSPQHEGVVEFVTNAHLIAAAPDMYEALEQVEKDALRYDEYQPMTLMQIGKALAKAEGKNV